MTPTPIVLHTAAHDTPLAFTLNGVGQITPESIVADFDGSGAGGPFDAVLTITLPDGKIISQTHPVDPVAAGDSKRVTFHPFAKPAARAATGGGITDVFKVYKTVNQVINDGATANIVFDAQDVIVGTPYTTPDNIEFDCEPGVWQFGFQLRATGNNPGSTGILRAVLRDINGPTEFAEEDHFESVSGAVTSRFTVAAESPWDGSSPAPAIVVRVTNTLGYNATIEAGFGRTFLWGFRTVSP